MRWKIELFGGLRAEGAGRTITRFRTRKTGTLLAYLALNPGRSHPREALIELLWPGSSRARAGTASARRSPRSAASSSRPASRGEP